MASSLKLMLERVISANRLSNALELPLERKLGDLPRLKYVYADALPLPIDRKISEQPPATKDAENEDQQDAEEHDVVQQLQDAPSQLPKPKFEKTHANHRRSDTRPTAHLGNH